MKRLSLLALAAGPVLAAHQRGDEPIQKSGWQTVSTSQASVTSAEARPLQIIGYDGTSDTGHWETKSTNLKAGSNVLISEGLNREDVVAEHQEFLKSDEAKGWDQLGTQYQTPYKPSKSRTFFVFLFLLRRDLFPLIYNSTIIHVNPPLHWTKK